jgi:hypothetical protein
MAEQEPLLSAEAVTWAFRLLIGREPASPEEVERHRRLGSIEKLRTAFAHTWEFQDYADRASMIGRPNYRLPLFLLRPPEDPAIPFRFAAPTLDKPVCQLCTAGQLAEPAMAEIMAALGTPHDRGRRAWENAYVVAALAEAGIIAEGKRVLALDCGRSRIPALLAARGVTVLASDPPGTEVPEAVGDDPEARARHHLLGMLYPDVAVLDEFEALVDWREVDPHAIPPDLAGSFDALFSVGTMPLAGSLELALSVLTSSLAALKPGGIAVHTLEFSLASNTAIVSNARLSVLRRIDLERLATSLAAEGHSLAPLCFHPGDAEEDEEITSGPAKRLLPKRRFGAHMVGLFGVIVRKKG